MNTAASAKKTALENNMGVSSFWQKLWSFSIFTYIVFMIAFESTSNTAIFSTISLYSFLLVSTVNILLNKSIRYNYFIMSMLLYFAVMIFAFFYTPSQAEAVNILYDFFTVCIICFFVINYLDSEERVYFILNAFIVGGVCLCLYTFSFYGFSVFDEVVGGNRIVRVGSDVGNVNFLGMAYAYSALFSLFFLINRVSCDEKFRRLKSMLYLLAVIICIFFLLLTGSKKAFILLGTGIIILFFLKKGNDYTAFKKILLGVFAIGMVVMIFNLIQNMEMFRAINQRLNELVMLLTSGSGSDSDNYRLSLTKQGLEIFSLNPLLGSGTGASRHYFGTYSHNNYVEILMNTGIIGFVVFYSSIVNIFFRLITSGNGKSAFKACGILIIIAHLLMGFGLVYYYDRYDQIMIAVASAFASFNLQAGKSIEA
jgi:O-antigen ligase